MPSLKVYSNANKIDFSLHEIEERPEERSVLLVSPENFDVTYVINPHMQGNIGTVNQQRAISQWNKLKEVYQSLGYAVHVIPSIAQFPDMVFCANQSFPYIDSNGIETVIISKMNSPYRQGEEIYFAQWYEDQKYKVIQQVSPPVDFEGMGDVLWHPKRKLLYSGYGIRTEKSALQRLANCVDCSVIGLELIHPAFYHLDTALAPLDEHTALYVKEAFTASGEEMLQQLFSTLIQVPYQEAKEGFVANGHCPDGKHFIVQKDNTTTTEILRQLDFQVIEVDTSEFMKSGGSVFCMKMMLP
jgi:N-dimethylarginine dimethylaminohydrolase